MQKKWPDEQRVKEVADLFRLYFYLYTPPKRNIILDLPGSLLWGGIVPGGVFVLLAIYLNRIVAGQAFPRAGCVRIAPLKILVLDRIGREVLVPLYDYTGIAFSECDAVPGCFGHGIDVILFYLFTSVRVIEATAMPVFLLNRQLLILWRTRASPFTFPSREVNPILVT
jgi:hypothetical protein